MKSSFIKCTVVGFSIFTRWYNHSWDFPGGSAVKNPPAMQEIQETQVQFLGWEDPIEGGHGNLLQYSCLENPHGLRRLVGYSPQGRKESDTSEATEHGHTAVTTV